MKTTNEIKAGPPITQLEFEEQDFPAAERIAKRLGYTQTAYTSTSGLWGLFCLRDRASQKAGCIIKTKEFGLLFVMDVEDMNMDPKMLEAKAETVIDRNTFISWSAKGGIDPMSLVNYGLNAFHASKSTAADLLAALEELTERYEQLDRRLVAGQHTEPNGTISRAKAAIAKAKTLSA